MSQAHDEFFAHQGPWSEADYLGMPEEVDHRIELLDGGLLVNPPPPGSHQRLSSRLWQALDRAVPEGFEVLEAIGVRVGPGQILIPDLAAVTNPGADPNVWEPADVVMVVELVSKGSVARDRAIKPQLYAQAGIPYYLRIERHPRGPVPTMHRLGNLGYEETHRGAPGEPFVLTEPFPVTLDLARLARTTRAGG